MKIRPFETLFGMLRRYRDVIIHALVGAAVHGVVVFVLAPNNTYKFLWATLALIVWLQLALLFNQKRLFNKRLGILDDILESQFGFSLEDNQYNRRSRHFRAEKIRLAGTLTNSVLPGIIVDWSPFLRQAVKTHFSLNGELSHGIVTQAVHAGV